MDKYFITSIQVLLKETVKNSRIQKKTLKKLEVVESRRKLLKTVENGSKGWKPLNTVDQLILAYTSPKNQKYQKSHKIPQKYPKSIPKVSKSILKVLQNYPKSILKVPTRIPKVFQKYPKRILKLSQKYPKSIQKVS